MLILYKMNRINLRNLCLIDARTIEQEIIWAEQYFWQAIDRVHFGSIAKAVWVILWNVTDVLDCLKGIRSMREIDIFILNYLHKNGYKESYCQFKEDLSSKWLKDGVESAGLL